jgi:hypothetical protein
VRGRLYSAGSIVDERKPGFEFISDVKGLVLEDVEPETVNDYGGGPPEDAQSPPKKIMVHKKPEGIRPGKASLARKPK